jgi:hypothetical protein
MNLESLLQASIYRADLEIVDSHFGAIGITDLTGMLHLKSALVTLANFCDFELTVRPTYKEHPEPSAIVRPLRKNMEFSKYLRNKFVGHIHPDLIAKAIEWQPILRHAATSLDEPKAMLMVNLWILETTINTYIDADGKHKVFDGETDLMYPPDWARFLDFLETTVRGGIYYLNTLQQLWGPNILPNLQDPFDLELALKAGKTEFKFLAH